MRCVETKIQDHKAERIKIKLGQDWKVYVNPTILNGRI